MGYKQKPCNAREGRGQRGNHNERIEPGLKVDYDQQVNKHDREGKSTQQTDVGGAHGLNLSTDNHSRTTRQLLARGVYDLVYITSHAAQIASCDRAKDIDNGRHV